MSEVTSGVNFSALVPLVASLTRANCSMPSTTDNMGVPKGESGPSRSAYLLHFIRVDFYGLWPRRRGRGRWLLPGAPTVGTRPELELPIALNWLHCWIIPSAKAGRAIGGVIRHFQISESGRHWPAARVKRFAKNPQRTLGIIEKSTWLSTIPGRLSFSK